MAKKVDEEYYEDKEERRLSLIKRLGITILVILGIIIIFFLLKGCEGFKKEKDLNTTLLEAGKEYYEYNAYLLPSSIGDCKTVSLSTLINEDLIDKAKYTGCDSNSTYVKVCKLESGKLHFVAFLNCDSEVTDNQYKDWAEGNESDIIEDSSDIKFTYKVEYLNTSSSLLGETEELWEDEITYSKFKTISTTKYYRYKDLQYIWNITSKKYYPGDKADASNVKEYYIVAPSNKYNNKDNENKSVSKYFSAASQNKVYWVNEAGTKKVSATAPDDVYIYSDNAIYQTWYRTRTWTETSKPVTAAPTQVWYCASPNDVNQIVSFLSCDTQTNNPGYTITVKMIYTCDGGLTEVGQNGVCYRCTDGSGLKSDKTSCGNYSSWSKYSQTLCDITSDLCEAKTAVGYNWYKLEYTEKKYYPSNATDVSKENTYYVSAPIAGLIKDTSTTTTGWKWYKKVSSQTINYYTTAPQSDATKTGTSKWTEFTSWATTKPASLGNAGTRIVETKNKIKLRTILGDSDEWLTFNEEFMDLEPLLLLLQEKGYKVYSLDDINTSGELRYKIKLYVRNKEVKK